MKKLGAMAHFKTRTRVGGDGAPSGGYCWVYGKFGDWDAFEEAVTRHFRRHFRYDVVEFENKQSFETPPASETAAKLVGQLDRFPIQYQTMHFYAGDDA